MPPPTLCWVPFLLTVLCEVSSPAPARLTLPPTSVARDDLISFPCASLPWTTSFFSSRLRLSPFLVPRLAEVLVSCFTERSPRLTSCARVLVPPIARSLPTVTFPFFVLSSPVSVLPAFAASESFFSSSFLCRSEEH